MSNAGEKFTTYGYRHQTSGGGRGCKSCGRLSWMVQTTLKGWNELLDYLQANNAFRKSKFMKNNFNDSTLVPTLSTIQDVLDYLNEFIALQSVRYECYKLLTKPILLP